MSEKIKLVLADDHPMIRAGFRALLGQTDDYEIVGEAGDGRELIQLIGKTQPQVALVDITMPGMNGLEAMERLRVMHPELKLLVLSMHEEREYISKAMKAGADGYVLKNVDRTELEKAIRTVVSGHKYFSSEIASKLADASSNRVGEALDITPREKQVLAMVAAGQSTKQIADKLGISVRTVETHRINMLKKLDVNNSAELVRKGFEKGLLN